LKDEKGKENHKMSPSLKRMCPSFLVVLFRFANDGVFFFFDTAVEYIHEAQPARSVRSRSESSIISFVITTLRCRSTTAPDVLASTFKLSATTTQIQTQDTRARFNSLDSGLLLSQLHVQVNANSNTNHRVRYACAAHQQAPYPLLWAQPRLCLPKRT
jgi:hypothetical protein